VAFRKKYKASREARLSRLPGRLNGPADAYRHIVGMAELTRRVGALQAYGMGESNEQLSWARQIWAEINGRELPLSLTREGRIMDRNNNAIGQRIGMRASTPQEVIAAARVEMEHAYQSGPGRPNGATWLQLRYQSGHPPGEPNWPPREWPNVADSDHLRAYAGRDSSSVYDRASRTGIGAGGGVNVSPHFRGGHPVQGYQRSLPSR
jgi:hypothetical protein